MALSIKQYKPEDRIVCLAKGEPGTGKTVGITSWAKQGPMYIFDVDHRLAPIKKMYRGQEDILNNLFFDQFDGYDDSYKKLESIHDETRDNLRRSPGSPEKACPYRSLVYDGLTPLGRNLINQAIEMRIESIDDPKDLKKQVKRAGIYVAQIEDYMGESQGISNILALLRSTIFEKAKVNIFLTAHVVEVETRNQKNEVTHVSRTLLTGGRKIAAEIPAYFNEIWHFDVRGSAGKPVYEIITNHGGDDFAKTAMTLPPKIEWSAPKLLVDEVLMYANNHELSESGKESEAGPRTRFNPPVTSVTSIVSK
jgi:hypothetical protein